MKNTTRLKGGFSSIMTIFITLGVIVFSGVFTHLLTPSPQTFNSPTSVDQDQEQNQNLVDLEENQQFNEDLVLELEISSLSRAEGEVNLYWGKPGGFATGDFERATATPLDLVEGLKITNNTDEPIFLDEINNESRELLTTIPAFRAWESSLPVRVLLLPEKFIKNEKEEVVCEKRDLFSDSINNICYFATPVIIAPNETVTLRPLLFAVPSIIWMNPPYKYTRENVSFLDGIDTKEIVYETINNKHYVFLSGFFHGVGNMSENIGGLILVNARDKKFVNNVFSFKTGDGKRVYADVKTNTGTGFIVKPLSLPSKGFEVEENKFDEDVHDFQIFLYRNNFMDKVDISGKYDEKTANAIKLLQKSTGIVETGKPDDATIFVSRGFNTGVYLYENYGDEELTISFDSTKPYFRSFSIGTMHVELNKDFSDSSLIEKVVEKIDCERGSCPSYAYSLDGHDFFALNSITILNNTPEVKSCTLTDPNGILAKSFQIMPNNMYSQRTWYDMDEDDIDIDIDILDTRPVIYHLQCGDKALYLELFFSKSRG